MQVKVAANEPEVGEHNATLHITYVDDWGKAHTTDFNIGQMEMGGTKQTRNHFICRGSQTSEQCDWFSKN